MTDDLTTRQTPENNPTLAAHSQAAEYEINLSSTQAAYIAEAVLAASGLRDAVIAKARYEHSTSSLVDGQELCDGCHEAVPCMTATILSRVPQGEQFAEESAAAGVALPAVRRVAPDREKLDDLHGDILHALRMDHGHTTANEMQTCKTCTRRADQMTEIVERWASGVLGVPAEQRTADRETIARALYNLHPYSPTYPHNIGRPLRWEQLHQSRRDHALTDADALLTVLVPADQVRAETLEAEADRVRAVTKESADLQRASDLEEGLPLIGTSTANEVEWYQMGNWAEGLLRTHAAEYRKAAGA